MSRIKPDRVKRDLPNWTIAQLLDLYMAVDAEFERRNVPNPVEGNMRVTFEDYQRYLRVSLLLESKFSFFLGQIQGRKGGRIGQLVEISPGVKRWETPYTEKDAGYIAGLLQETRILTEKFGTSVRFERYIAPKHEALIEGIRALLVERDDTPLRKLAGEYIFSYEDKSSEYIQNLPAPGVKRDDVIDRLCARAKPYRVVGDAFPEIYDQIMADLKDPKTPQEASELEKLARWSVDDLRKAYNRRYELG